MQWFILLCATSAVATLPALNIKEKQITMNPPRIVYQTSAKMINELTPKQTKISNTRSTNSFVKTEDTKADIKEPLRLLPAPPALLPRSEKHKKSYQKKDTEFVFHTVGDHIANIKVGPVFPNGIRPKDFHYNIPTAPTFIPELDEKEDDIIYKYDQFINDTTIAKYENSAETAKVSQIAISPPPNTPLYFLPVDHLKNQAKYDILRDVVLKVMKAPGTIVGVLVLPNNLASNEKV